MCNFVTFFFNSCICNILVRWYVLHLYVHCKVCLSIIAGVVVWYWRTRIAVQTPFIPCGKNRDCVRVCFAWFTQTCLLSFSEFYLFYTRTISTRSISLYINSHRIGDMLAYINRMSCRNDRVAVIGDAKTKRKWKNAVGRTSGRRRPILWRRNSIRQIAIRVITCVRDDAKLFVMQ